MEKVKVLIVDGREKEIEEIFQGEYNMIKATSEERAIEAVRKEEPDLMVLDMEQPRIDETKVLRELRDLNLSLPVVAVSALETVEAAVQAMKKGACDYLTKPLNPEELRMAVRRGLDKNKRDSKGKKGLANCMDMQMLIDEVKESMLEREASLEEAKKSFEEKLLSVILGKGNLN